MNNPPKDEYLQFPYSSQQSQPSVQVLASHQSHPKIDYLPPSSQASDQTKQLQALNGVSSHQIPDQTQPQTQQQLPSARAFPKPQNPPKSSHHQPPSSQISDQSHKEEFHHHPPNSRTSDQPKKQEPEKGNHDLSSNQSSNQPQHGKQLPSAQVPPWKQNPAKSDDPPASNKTSLPSETKQPQNGVPSENFSSKDPLKQQLPTDKKSPNQHQQQPPSTPLPRSSDNFGVPGSHATSIAEGYYPKPHPTTPQADPPSQPPKTIQNNIALARGMVSNEPVLAFPDPNQLPPSAPPPPPSPSPAKKKKCCSIL